MKKDLILFFLICFIAQGVMAQSMTSTYSTIPCDNDGVLDVSTTGLLPPITFQYYIGGTTITHPNVNSTTDQLTNIPMTNSGMAVYATDGSGNAWDYPSYTPAFSFYTTSNNAICPSTMGTLSATQTSGGAGPFTYTWTDTLTLLTYSGNPASAPVGVYNLLIEDAGTGCVLDLTDSIAAQIHQSSSVTASISSTAAGCSDGTATAVASGGVAPYTYLWMNGATGASQTGLSQGNYGVVVTDAQGCSSSTIWTNVSQNPVITVNTTVTDATCIQSDGEILAFGSGGVPPYTYNWDNGQTGANATNLTGGSWYNVVVTDANGCFGNGGAYVNTSTPITVTFNSTPSSCVSPTGTSTLTVAGGTAPYTYSWNTNPVQTGQTLTNVSSGQYGFTVIDAVGCVRTGNVWVQPESTISATLSTANVVCPATTGSALINVNGSNPPFTYLWSNGATTSQITGAPLGAYSCTVTDNVGCSVTKSGSIISSTDINVGLITTPVSCLYSTDGEATVQATSGTPPYTYLFSDGSSAVTASGLSMGEHFVVVTDANGCSKSKTFYIGNAATNTDCYCTIEGYVYLDDNADCILDGGEVGIENIMVHCSDQGYAFTDANGYYSFQVPTGAYTITEQVNAYYPLQTCQSIDETVNVVASAGCVNTVNIANQMNLISDLKISTFNSSIPPVPGNVYSQKVVVTNLGTITENDVQMGYEHDGQLIYLSSSLPSFVQAGDPNHYSVSTGFPSLDPGASDMMLLTYNVPTNIAAGTEIDIHDTIANLAPIATNWLLDYSPWNNVNHFEPIVVASYDPNYKEVHPRGMGPQGYITSNVNEFEYTVHFQNEGTYYAQNIYIKDQLDEDFDWTTLMPGYSDYNYTTTVSETGLVTFTFANINLPWKSAFGDALSSGLVNFSIRRKDDLPQGTEFTNYADIYFDYNDPITTNTVINTMDDEEFNSTPVTEIENVDEVSVDVYPVPAGEMITFRVNNVSHEETVTLLIIDITGKIVSTEQVKLGEGTNYINHNISNLETGNYFSKLQFSNGEFLVNKIIRL